MVANDLLEIARSRAKAYSSRSGKLVFDTMRNTKKTVAKFSGCEVKKIWVEVCVETNGGYSQVITPVLCMYLSSVDVEKANPKLEVE